MILYNFYFNAIFLNIYFFILNENFFKNEKNLVFSANFKYNWSVKFFFFNNFKNNLSNLFNFTDFDNFCFYNNYKYDYLHNSIDFKKNFGFFKKKFSLSELTLNSFEFSKVNDQLIEVEEITNSYLVNEFLNNSFSKNDFEDNELVIFDYTSKFNLVLHNNRLFFLSFFKKKFKKKIVFSKIFKNFFKKNTTTILFFFEFSLLNILQVSQLFFNKNDVLFFLKNNYIQVNNFIKSNPFFSLKTGDKISVIFDSFYFLYFRNILNLFNKNILRFVNYNYILNQKVIAYGKQIRTTSPRWAENLIYINYDIPNYIEIDYVILTLCCIYKPIFLSEFNELTLNFINVFLSRLYVWRLVV